MLYKSCADIFGDAGGTTMGWRGSLPGTAIQKGANASLNVAAINVSKTANSQTLANGNQIADLGTYVKTDGSTGGLGEIHGLADDAFATATAALPDMRGSGAVRDLREATTQSSALQTLLTQYAAAPTRTAQMALIDQMLDAWADTSGYAETLDARAGARYIVRYDSFGNVTRATHLVSGAALAGGLTPDVDNPQLDTTYRNTIAQWNQRIHIFTLMRFQSYLLEVVNSAEWIRAA